ncbi:protein quaking-A-like isoform X2 [Clavelina lepadiformis]|uniref:protein quaking-A-like isoform X2 n=1 Tax=Clavelina lepadiformis TaxID=159417 RepID=UPI004041E5D5
MMLQQPLHPVQLQLIQQPPPGPQITQAPPTLPQQQTHIQIQSPPPINKQQQQINYHQTTLISPPGSSTSPSSSSGASSASQILNNFNNISPSAIVGGEDDKKVRDKCLYLKQLLQDKKQIQSLSGCFLHVDRILDEEIVKVRSVLFQNGDKQPLELPPPQGATITLTEKVYVPVKDHPEYNFVGRLLGPRGLTAKQLEQETKCKIMVRGKGSMRDKKKEDMNRGKPNWEHLNDELHVLITVEDTENRARVKIQRAIEEIQKLLVPTDGEDELKKKQLMELAIINGTYRDYSNVAGQPRIVSAPQVLQSPTIRSPTPGQPSMGMFNSPIISRLPNGQTVITNSVAQAPPMIAPSDGSLLYYTPLEYPHSAITLPEYNLIDPTSLLGTAGASKIVRPNAGSRVHPYQRPPATN